MCNVTSTFGVKKIILIFGILFISIFQNTFADSVVFYNPQYGDISSTAISDGSTVEEDYIKEDSKEQFCIELNGDYVNSETKTGTGYVNYNGSEWTHSDNSTDILKSVTCDIGTDFAGLNSNANPLDTDLPLFVVNNGVVYVNKDNFYYMVVTVAVILLLFRSIIHIFQLSYFSGKNISNGKGLKINKK